MMFRQISRSARAGTDSSRHSDGLQAAHENVSNLLIDDQTILYCNGKLVRCRELLIRESDRLLASQFVDPFNETTFLR